MASREAASPESGLLGAPCREGVRTPGSEDPARGHCVTLARSWDEAWLPPGRNRDWGCPQPPLREHWAPLCGAWLPHTSAACTQQACVLGHGCLADTALSSPAASPGATIRRPQAGRTIPARTVSLLGQWSRLVTTFLMEFCRPVAVVTRTSSNVRRAEARLQC